MSSIKKQFTIEYLLREDDTSQSKSSNKHHKPTKKQARTAFTQHQISELENEFLNSHYLTIDKRNEMSSRLSLTENQIKIWFQNRRTKLKRSVYVQQQQRKQERKLYEIYRILPTVLDNNFGVMACDLKKLYEEYSAVTYKKICQEALYTNN